MGNLVPLMFLFLVVCVQVWSSDQPLACLGLLIQN